MRHFSTFVAAEGGEGWHALKSEVDDALAVALVDLSNHRKEEEED